MSDRDITTVSALLGEIKAAHDEILRADAERVAALANKADKAEVERITKQLSTAVENLSRKLNRPGAGNDGGNDSDRANAVALLEQKHLLRVPKHEPSGEYKFAPTEQEIEEASLAIKGWHGMLRTVDAATLPDVQRKALTSFQLGSSGYILPPEMGAQILSCLVDPTDVVGLTNTITISGPSIRYLVDNVQFGAQWVCEADCWNAGRVADLAAGLTELEIKAEELRFVVCTSRDLLEDASVNVENWLMTKAQKAFGSTISNAIMVGTGVGMPIGILNPAAGIPICDVSASTPASQFTWQDLFQLKWQVNRQWHANGSFLMNQNTFALALTMSDANGRPLMVAMPTDAGLFMINGSPVNIVSQMPDIGPGATPVAFGDWKAAYLTVNRKAVTMLSDPFTAGFCVLEKFSARVGGGIVCSNAARLLRTL